MSKDSFNAPTVPHYASPKTRPLRPKAPRELPDWVVACRIRRQQTYQAIYRWIRRNFTEGDKFYLSGDAPDQPTYSLANRYGIYRGLKSTGYTSRVQVAWLDDGHKIQVEPTTFYRCASKLDADDNEVPVDKLDFGEDGK